MRVERKFFMSYYLTGRREKNQIMPTKHKYSDATKTLRPSSTSRDARYTFLLPITYKRLLIGMQSVSISTIDALLESCS